MSTIYNFRALMRAIVVCGVVLLGVTAARAHCDGLDGPVVLAAQQALRSGNVKAVLIWVPRKDEAEITRAFEQARTVRRLSADAQQLADTWFFETLVRVHRAGEGFPFAGLQPAGRDLGPAIPAADKAVETGRLDDVLKLLPAEAHTGARERFGEVIIRKNFNPEDVDAGRAFVAAYVAFVHFVEEQYGGGLAGAFGCGHRAGDADVGDTGRENATGKPVPHAEHAPRHDVEPKPAERGARRIPAPLKAEHEELHAALGRATRAGGAVGAAASAVAEVLHPHFVKEEEYALPPLGWLAEVARRGVTPAMADVLPLTDKLAAELPQMVADHKVIMAALERLGEAARKDGDAESARLAEKLTMHAQTEEQVLYPAAVVLGEFIKARLAKAD